MHNLTLRPRAALCTLALALAICTRIAGAPPKPEDFDGRGGRPKDGRLDDREYAAYIKHLKVPGFAEIDTDKDGEISPAELAAFQRNAEGTVASWTAEIARFPDTADPSPSLPGKRLEHVAEIAPPPPAPPPGLFMNYWRIRGDIEGMTASSFVTNFAKASGALIGLSNDRIKNVRQMSARGAIFHTFPETPRKPAADQPDWGSAFGVTFDVKETRYAADPQKKGANDIDDVAGKWLFEYEIPDLSGFFRTTYLRGGPVYRTDSRLDSEQMGVELDVEPLLRWRGFRGFAVPLGSLPIQFRTRQVLHFETGKVNDAGTKTGLAVGETYFRAGPRLTLDLFPSWEPLDTMVLSASLQRLDGTGTGPRSSNLLEYALTFPLDNVGHRLLKASYRKGQQPSNGSAWIDTFDLSLGLKY